MTRMLFVVGALILAFFLVGRVVPEGLLLPLYCLFSAGGMGYVLWERRRIGGRRATLERELEHERLRGPGTDLPWGKDD
jgi:hypothetical protein